MSKLSYISTSSEQYRVVVPEQVDSISSLNSFNSLADLEAILSRDVYNKSKRRGKDPVTLEVKSVGRNRENIDKTFKVGKTTGVKGDLLRLRDRHWWLGAYSISIQYPDNNSFYTNVTHATFNGVEFLFQAPNDIVVPSLRTICILQSLLNGWHLTPVIFTLKSSVFDAYPKIVYSMALANKEIDFAPYINLALADKPFQRSSSFTLMDKRYSIYWTGLDEFTGEKLPSKEVAATLQKPNNYLFDEYYGLTICSMTPIDEPWLQETYGNNRFICVDYNGSSLFINSRSPELVMEFGTERLYHLSIPTLTEFPLAYLDITPSLTSVKLAYIFTEESKNLFFSTYTPTLNGLLYKKVSEEPLNG